MSNRTQLEQQAGKMQAELDKLREQIKQLPEVNERWKPGNGEWYYYLNSCGDYQYTRWDSPTFDNGNYNMGNCFKTEEEVELHILRLESMSNRWKPDAGELFYFWNFASGSTRGESNFKVFAGEYLIGNMHPTREAAQAWYDRFGRSWEALLK